MKKKIIGIAMVAIMAIGTTIAFNQSNEKITLDELTSTNVEALAFKEPYCPNGCLEGCGVCECNGTHNYPEYK